MKKRIEMLMSKNCSLKSESVDVNYDFDITEYEKKVSTFFENAEYIFRESPSQLLYENSYSETNLRLGIRENGIAEFYLNGTDTITEEIQEKWNTYSPKKKLSLYETYFEKRVEDIKERLAFLNEMIKE